jgi:hypothetical protein
MSKYLLKLRIAEEYHAVNWTSGRVCWDDDNSIEPTVFTAEGRRTGKVLINLYPGWG